MTNEHSKLVFDSVSIHWLPGIIKEFKKDYPGIKVDIFDLKEEKLLAIVSLDHELAKENKVQNLILMRG